MQTQNNGAKTMKWTRKEKMHQRTQKRNLQEQTQEKIMLDEIYYELIGRKT